jgi:hypothetical protein
MARDRRHPKVQQKVAVLVAIEPDAWFICDLKNYRSLVEEFSVYNCQKISAHPIETASNFYRPRSANPLQFAQLVISKRSMVRLVGVLATKSDHPLRVMMMLDAPRGIEVVPSQVRASATLYGAAEPDLLAQGELDGTIWISGWTHTYPFTTWLAADNRLADPTTP